MFFAPYTPGEITFYGLLFGGYKLHKKFKKWDEEYKQNQLRRRKEKIIRDREEWFQQYLPMTYDNYFLGVDNLESDRNNKIITIAEYNERCSLLNNELVRLIRLKKL